MTQVTWIWIMGGYAACDTLDLNRQLSHFHAPHFKKSTLPGRYVLETERTRSPMLIANAAHRPMVLQLMDCRCVDVHPSDVTS